MFLIFLKKNKSHKLILAFEIAGMLALISRLMTNRIANYIAFKLIEDKSNNKNN